MSKAYVAFTHVEGGGAWNAEDTERQREIARVMIASCRRAMPGIQVKQMTDHKTPAIDGVDEVWRRSNGGWFFIPWLCDFCSGMEGEVLYLDTDVVVQKDLRTLFSVPCDVLFTTRGMKIVDGRPMPFIFGVVPYRRAEFWSEVRDRVLQMPELEQMWYGSQVAVWEMFMEEKNGRGKWKIATVDRNEYNYTPQSADDLPDGKWLLHYKGRKRKAWMLEHWGHLIEQREAA